MIQSVAEEIYFVYSAVFYKHLPVSASLGFCFDYPIAVKSYQMSENLKFHVIRYF